MTTIRENILDQIKTALTGTTGVSSRIYRERVTPLTNRSQLPALVIEPLSDTASHASTLPKIEWSLQVRIVCLVNGSASSTPYETADPTIESLHSNLTSDLTLNGNAIDIQIQSVDFELIDADQALGAISSTYEIRYRTSQTDLSA